LAIRLAIARAVAAPHDKRILDGLYLHEARPRSTAPAAEHADTAGTLDMGNLCSIVERLTAFARGETPEFRLRPGDRLLRVPEALGGKPLNSFVKQMLIPVPGGPDLSADAIWAPLRDPRAPSSTSLSAVHEYANFSPNCPLDLAQGVLGGERVHQLYSDELNAEPPLSSQLCVRPGQDLLLGIFDRRLPADGSKRRLEAIHHGQVTDFESVPSQGGFRLKAEMPRGMLELVLVCPLSDPTAPTMVTRWLLSIPCTKKKYLV